jgi:hypothetical protein
LSSVLLGGLTFLYGTLQQHRAENTRKNDSARRLKVEISGRVSNGIATMRQNARRIERGEKSWTKFDYYSEATNFLDKRVNVNDYGYDFSTYPEYKKRSFRDLPFELGTLADQSELAALQEARASNERLADLADDAENESDVSKEKLLNAVNKKAIEIFEQS